MTPHVHQYCLLCLCSNFYNIHIFVNFLKYMMLRRMSNGMFYIFSELLSLLIWRWTLAFAAEPLDVATAVVVAAVVGGVAEEVKEGEDVEPVRSFSEDMDVRVFWNQVFLVDWSSLTAVASWCVRSWRQESCHKWSYTRVWNIIVEIDFINFNGRVLGVNVLRGKHGGKYNHYLVGGRLSEWKWEKQRQHEGRKCWKWVN